MYDFSSIELDDQKHVFVMPQADCVFVTRALVAAGIDIECYGWSDIRDGKAPIDADSVSELIADDPAFGRYTTPCAIVSRVPERFMREASMQVHCEPLDPDVASYREALEARGDDIPDSSAFGSMEELEFCATEVSVIYVADIMGKLRAAEAEGKDTVMYSGSLDPLMYDEREHPVTHFGLLKDNVTGAIREYSTSQVCVVVHVLEDGDMPFEVEDAWPDVDVALAEPTGRDLLDGLKAGELYKSAGLIERAYLERSVYLGHDHPMMFFGGDRDAIVLYSPRIIDGVVCCACVSMDGDALMFTDTAGRPAVSPYADLPGKDASYPAVEYGESLGDEAVAQAFARDYPETAEIVADLHTRIERIVQEAAKDAGAMLAEALETGDFSNAPVVEDTAIPTDAGLFFPALGEGGIFMAYDDPEAAPAIDMLRSTGWEGQAWVVSDKPWYKQRFSGC